MTVVTEFAVVCKNGQPHDGNRWNESDSAEGGTAWWASHLDAYSPECGPHAVASCTITTSGWRVL